MGTETESQETSAPDLEHLPLGALQQLQSEVEAAISRKRNEKRREALREIGWLATEAQLTPEQVLAHLKGKASGRTSRSGGKLPPKYWDPENPTNTWAGRGKRPKWLETRLAAGARIEEFRIAPKNAGSGQSRPKRHPSPQLAHAGPEAAHIGNSTKEKTNDSA